MTEQDRQHAGRGDTVVRETLKFKSIILNLTSIEHAAVELIQLNGTTLTIAALYQKLNEGLSSSDLDQVENLNVEGEILIYADLKVKHTEWSGTPINTKARRLPNSPNIDIIPVVEPARVAPTTSSYINVFIVLTSVSTVNSDHKAVQLISRQSDFRSQTPKTVYDCNTIHCNKFTCSQTIPFPLIGIVRSRPSY